MNQENGLELIINTKAKIRINSFGWKTEYFEPVETMVDLEKVWDELSDEEKKIIAADENKRFVLASFSDAETGEDEISNAKVRLSYALVEKIYGSMFLQLLDSNGESIEQSSSVEAVRRYEMERKIEEARKEGFQRGYEAGRKAR